MKPSSNLVVDRAPIDEVLLRLDLMKMTKLANPISLGDVVVDFDSKIRKTNPKMPKGGFENHASNA